MKQLIVELKNREWKLASCESITGGDFASRLTDISGASGVYLGGYIVYSDEAKRQLTFIDDDVLREFGAISSESVKSMAIWTKKTSKLRYCHSIQWKCRSKCFFKSAGRTCLYCSCDS